MTVPGPTLPFRDPSLRLGLHLALLSLVAALCIAGSIPALAQEDYALRQDLVVTVDGAPDEEAEVFFSRQFPSYLILTPQLSSPVLIEPRSQAVREVHVLKVARQSDGTIDLLNGALLGQVGAIQTEGTTVTFVVEGKTLVMADKPPLLGAQTRSRMEAYSASYTELADRYSPDADLMAELEKATGDIRVRVFFGTWCPFCAQYVPRMLKVARGLKGTAIKMDFYGLPQSGFAADTEASRLKITAVPTGVVWVDGKEVGRITSDEWRTPEKALAELVSKK